MGVRKIWEVTVFIGIAKVSVTATERVVVVEVDGIWDSIWEFKMDG